MRPLIQAVSRKSILAAVFVFALAASVAAAPQRGGGGGHSGGGGGHFQGGHFAGGGPGGHFDGHHGDFGHGHVFIGGGFFDPFWGPYYPYGYGYPYGYPYGVYDNSLGSVKTEVTPKQAEVYVDGYYAGVASDFDGVFQGLHTVAGGHTLTLHLDGYRTVTENIYVRPDSTVKVKEAMARLAPGEVSQPVSQPIAPTEPSDSMTPSDGGTAPQL
jgi:hypothetical protein